MFNVLKGTSAVDAETKLNPQVEESKIKVYYSRRKTQTVGEFKYIVWWLSVVEGINQIYIDPDWLAVTVPPLPVTGLLCGQASC